MPAAFVLRASVNSTGNASGRAGLSTYRAYTKPMKAENAKHAPTPTHKAERAVRRGWNHHVTKAAAESPPANAASRWKLKRRAPSEVPNTKRTTAVTHRCRGASNEPASTTSEPMRYPAVGSATSLGNGPKKRTKRLK